MQSYEVGIDAQNQLLLSKWNTNITASYKILPSQNNPSGTQILIKQLN